MRSAIFSSALVLVTTLTSSSTALQALTNSPCAAQCGNVQSTTQPEDIVCHDSDFKGVAAGQVYQSCVSCQLTSKYQDPVTRQTDLQWALYNIRYAISYCLFNWQGLNSNWGSTPCITSTACGPLEPMFEFDSLSPNVTAYSYCTLNKELSVPKCHACLGSLQGQFFLTNFATVIEGGCQQQPSASDTISLQGSIFSLTTTNITSPSAVPTGSYTPSTGGLTLGAKIGIVVGGILFILGLTGFCIVYHGKRRRRNYLKQHQQQSGYADWRTQQEAEAARQEMSTAGTGHGTAGAFFDSPQSQRPLVPGAPWGGHKDEESPASGMGEKAYFSPYSSQYNSPVSASEQLQVISQQWPIDRKGSVGGSTGIGGFPGRSRSREGKREPLGNEFELQNVAPVLLQPTPGHGRQGSLGLTEADKKKGNAI